MKMNKEQAIKTGVAVGLSAVLVATTVVTSPVSNDSGSKPAAPAASGESIFVPGTYTGSGQGFGGTVNVTITVDETTITDAAIDAANETPTIGGAAVEELQSQLLAAQSAEIDGVSGAP